MRVLILCLLLSCHVYADDDITSVREGNDELQQIINDNAGTELEDSNTVKMARDMIATNEYIMSRENEE